MGITNDALKVRVPPWIKSAVVGIADRKLLGESDIARTAILEYLEHHYGIVPGMTDQEVRRRIGAGPAEGPLLAPHVAGHIAAAKAFKAQTVPTGSAPARNAPARKRGSPPAKAKP